MEFRRLNLLLLLVGATLFQFALAEVVVVTDDTVDDHLRRGNWIVLLENSPAKDSADGALWVELDKHISETDAPFKVAKVDCDKYPDVCLDTQVKLTDLPKKFTLAQDGFVWTPNTGTDPAGIVASANYALHGYVDIITAKNFDKVLSGEPWFVYFYGKFCSICRQIDPVWRHVATELKKQGVHVAKMDVSEKEEKEISGRQNLLGLPAFRLFKDNQTFDHHGGRDLQDFVRFIAKPVPTKQFDPKPITPPVPEPEVEIELVDETGKGDAATHAESVPASDVKAGEKAAGGGGGDGEKTEEKVEEKHEEKKEKKKAKKSKGKKAKKSAPAKDEL